MIPKGFVRPPYWEDRPTIIVGTGPSLKGFDLKQLEGLGYIIAVNGAMHDFPFADAWCTIDQLFVIDNYRFLSDPGPDLYIGREISFRAKSYNPIIERAIYLQRAFNGGSISFDPGTIECGGSSGYGALNLAVLKRSKMIFLFGFDYQNTGHYNPQVYKHRKQEPKWHLWLQMFEHAKRVLDQFGISVINANPTSAITCFQRVTHDQALGMLRKR